MRLQVFSYCLVTRLLGILLLAAAGLKVFGLANETVFGSGFLSTPTLQLAGLELEILLGLWLLWGKYPIGSWIVTTVLFLAFAGVNLHLAWTRQPSCACFGQLAVNPWYALGIDVALLSLLLAARSDLRLVRESPRLILTGSSVLLIRGSAGVAVIVLFFASLSYLWFDTPADALAFLRGERVSAEPSSIDLGEARAGERREVGVRLLNRADHPIRIIGGTSDCSCIATTGLPIAIPSAESRLVMVQVKFAGAPGVFSRTAVLFTNDELQKKVVLRLAGKVTKPNDDGGPEAGRSL